jgi:hypothetical protein
MRLEPLAALVCVQKEQMCIQKHSSGDGWFR